MRTALPALRSRLPRSGRGRASRHGERGRGEIGIGIPRDLAHALRMLRRGPGFAAVVLLTLAVGIGATTAVFSVVDGVLLRPLPYPDAERILHLWERPPRGGRSWVSAPNFRDWRGGLESFAEIAALTPSGFNVSGEGGPERTEGVEVTPGFFGVLGAELALGRGFLAGEGGGPPARVAVISHGLWRRQFGGSPDALGRTLTLEGTPYEVVGVLPSGASYPAGTEVWVPVDLTSADWKRNRGTKWLMVVGRLGDGVSPQTARAEMDALGRALAEEHPESNEGTAIAAASLRDEMVGDVRTPLLVLLGAVALVLLVVSVSLAGPGLARGARRRREVAIRRSLGGSPGRIVRQLLTEGLVFSVAGGALGLIVARWGLRGLVALAPPGVPRLQEVS
ncbi:MAG: FtsX-like permease family protein, partial [Gemmatimonadetes bacterium]|nr:FtsX-like permease family protein [Gemmatimonadota bacterium]NIR79732.1 FtsX-like permease family protein [Gemmatimonadota bacterium]NIT88436.1 FtsX-like permease family protein [Gemmatimonadota bacterium]NIU32251.1 FtsX-like permease family protein [Gemmatimonadota bacterium]NIU36792.1 FtsX-like permease family protein [Gemmatimonadota bacterium]